MRKLFTILFLATAFASTKFAIAVPIYTFDPGPVGSLFNEYWQSAQFPLDEPLSTVRFEVADGKLLNLLPHVGQNWRFGMHTSNHGLSQNYTAQKTLTFYDAEGAVLLAANGLGTTVYTQSGGASFWSSSPLLGIAAVEINYEPGLPEVGDDAAVDLFFNERFVSGTLQIVAEPELSGDFDGDGDVDGFDFLVWQRDPNVGLLSNWEGNYGMSLSANSAAVPEPSSVILALSFIPYGLRRCRRYLYTRRVKPIVETASC